ncbi:MAG: FAD:protein FMN transferase [Verrucomicrobiota bacterium]|nr:FAD:protein FMN transferase [Verrucomicrobiota bacterium]
MNSGRLVFSLGLFFIALGQALGQAERHEFSRPLMGMAFRIVVYAEAKPLGKRASDAAFDRVAVLNKIMSDYDPSSELSKLSDLAGSGKAARISDELYRVLDAGQALATNSAGAFDVTAGAATQLWRRARRLKRMPPEYVIESTRMASGYRALKLDEDAKTAELTKTGVRLDLGGIAKGYALDEALKVLHKHGLRQALVSAGGDIAAGDAPSGKPGWKIALLGLKENAAAEFIWVSNGAVATSGDLFQVLELDGKRHSHIVDPRTARAITEQRLVHVLAPTAMQADSLATAISVLGHKDGMWLVSGGKKLGARVAYRDALGQVKEGSNPTFRAWPRAAMNGSR